VNLNHLPFKGRAFKLSYSTILFASQKNYVTSFVIKFAGTVKEQLMTLLRNWRFHRPLYSFISRYSVILVGYVQFNASVIQSIELDKMGRKGPLQFNLLTQDLSG
jgi:hypothetical protein